jgi:hypothetical protein
MEPKRPSLLQETAKNDSWGETADSMKMDAEDCKNKMISLLATYRREKAETTTIHQ